MAWQDLFNGGFELLAAPFIFLSIMKLLKEKQVRGVSWVHVFYFTLWGLWNLYFYPHLNQWASFVGGLSIVVANGTWVILLIKYRKKG